MYVTEVREDRRVYDRLLQISDRQHLDGTTAIAGATDSSRRGQHSQFVTELEVQLNNSRRGLVGKDDGAAMIGEPFRGADLIIPAKAIFRVLSKLDVIRRVRIHEIFGPQRTG